jgi:hypothetical protein
MPEIKDRNIVLSWTVSAVCFAVLMIYHFRSDGYSDIGDGILHYQISHYSWKHPELLLHHWGKPFFTFISSPFAQFGYAGIVFFNILCASATAFFSSRMLSVAGYKFGAVAGLIAVFSPLYFSVTLSGLTEPLFSLVLTLSVFLVMKRRQSWAAILVSFLPFVRTEGFLLLPLFGLVFLIRQNRKAIPLLAFGTLVYSLVGGIATGNFGWVITGNPYTGEELYGHGEFFHFIKNNEAFLGTSGVVLFAAAFLLLIVRLVKYNKQHPLFNEEVLLIFGSFIVYLLAHSIFWAYGLFGSYGLLRVMAAVTPLAAVVAAGTLDLLYSKINQRRVWIPVGLAMVVVVVNTIQTLNQSRVPFRIDNSQFAAYNAGKWLKEHTHEKNTLYTQHPFIVFLAGYDPFDLQHTRSLWDLEAEKNSGQLPVRGSFIVWDSHFAALEGRTSIDSLKSNINYELVYHVKSEKAEYRTSGGDEWPEVYIFKQK